jgi:chorismate dehydratase
LRLNPNVPKEDDNMQFGSINYLNLLPFQVFMKRAIRHSAAKKAFGYRRAVPSAINTAFKRRKIDAAFISSVASARCRCTDLGIIAKGKVYSVLLLPDTPQEDPASASSNRLAQILGLKGKVLIGDAALQYWLSQQPSIDLAEVWYEKTGLPFVFARLCYNSHTKEIQKLTRNFSRAKIRIPQYILKKEAAKRGITPRQLSWYLNHIHYTMDWRAKQGLKKFLNA